MALCRSSLWDYNRTYERRGVSRVEVNADRTSIAHQSGRRPRGRWLSPYPNNRGFDVVLLGLKRFEPLPLKDAQKVVLAHLNAERRQANVSEVSLSEGLNQVAQDAADAVRSNQIRWNSAVGQVLKSVAKKRLARGRFGAGGTTTVNLDTLGFRNDNTALAPAMTQVGIGVASGPIRGTPRFIVIYVVAEKNSGPRND